MFAASCSLSLPDTLRGAASFLSKLIKICSKSIDRKFPISETELRACLVVCNWAVEKNWRNVKWFWSAAMFSNLTFARAEKNYVSALRPKTKEFFPLCYNWKGVIKYFLLNSSCTTSIKSSIMVILQHFKKYGSRYDVHNAIFVMIDGLLKDMLYVREAIAH